MSWASVTVTLRARNSTSLAAAYRQIVIDAMGISPYWVQEESGEREPGAGGLLLQNVVQRCCMDLIPRRFQIDQGEWDHGDYELLARALRGKHLWVHAVTDTIREQTNTTDGGTDFDYWTSGTGTVLPRKVIAVFDKPEYDFAMDRYMSMLITLRDELPTIGISIT